MTSSTFIQPRIAARKAELRRALHDGLVIDGARAAGRVRVDGTALSGRELLASRAIRSRLGRSLRLARRRRAQGPRTEQAPVVFAETAVTTHASARWPKAIAAALAIVGLLLLLLITRPAAPREEPGGGQPDPVPVALLPEPLRGVTIALPSAEPVAIALSEPSTTPNAVARPEIAPSTGSGGGSRGGVGTGTGTGSGSGTAAGTPLPPPAPTPAPTPVATLAPPVPAQSAVLAIIVVDAAGQPIPGVCLIIGTGVCSPSRPHTDAAGRWTTEVPLATPTLRFDITLVKTGYQQSFGGYTLLQGQTRTYTVRLYPPSAP